MPKKKAEPPPTDWMVWIEERRVKLQPVMDTAGTVDWWAAGFTTATRTGQNVTRTSATGLTPIAALQALHRGDCYVKDDVRLREPDPRRKS